MADYTANERKAIAVAWNKIEELAETNHDTERTVRDMLRIERTARKSAIIAKALLLQCMADNRPRTIGELYDLSPGCMMAAILAAHWRERKPEQFAKVAPAIETAANSHNSKIQRAFDELAK